MSQRQTEPSSGPEIPPAVQYASAPGKSRMFLAILALLCGVISIPGALFLCLADAVFGVLAIALGSIALIAAVKEPARHGGKALAIAGMCLGVLSLLLLAIIVATLHSSAL